MSTGTKLANQLLTITTALLSSSCCLIQMVLNLFSMSCAGFAVFTPYRSLLTGMTLLLLTTNVVRNGWRQTWKQTTISLLIMVSPEVVQWINIHPHIHGMAHEPIATTSSVVLQLDGLACIACANRIKNALTNIDCVQSASVFFDNSSAVIEYLNGCIPTTTKATDTFIDVIKGLDTNPAKEDPNPFFMIQHSNHILIALAVASVANAQFIHFESPSDASAAATSEPNHHSEPISTSAVIKSKAEPTTTIAHNSNHPFPSHHVDKPDVSAHKSSIAPATPTPAQQHHQATSSSSANHHHSNKSSSSPTTTSTSHEQHHPSLIAVSPASTTSKTPNTSSSSSTPTSSNTMLPSNQQKNQGLSGGAVTAIVIVGLIGLAGLIMWMVMRKRKRRAMLRGQAHAQQPDPFTMGFGSHDPPPHTAYNMTATASSHGTATTGPSPMIQMPPIGASANTSDLSTPPHPHPPVVGSGNDAPSYPYNSFSAQEGTTPHAIGVFTVISTYTPTLSDELNIQPGDRVEILIEYDDGWCKGINLSRGNVVGVFPAHCTDHYQYNNTQQPYYEPENMKRVSSMYISPHQNAQQQKAYYL